MTDTIPQPPQQLGDVRVILARRALAELPGAEDNERPYFWLGRLRAALEALLTGWPSGAPGGLDNGQREVLGQALADAIEHRTPPDWCADCVDSGEAYCCEHRADMSLCEAYVHLAAELGLDVAK